MALSSDLSFPSKCFNYLPFGMISVNGRFDGNKSD